MSFWEKTTVFIIVCIVFFKGFGGFAAEAFKKKHPQSLRMPCMI